MADLLKLARELFTVHGLMPVAVAGKEPLGGHGWNTLSLEDRLLVATASMCSGIGIQCGLTWHPVLGPLEARIIDCDINDRDQQFNWAMAFLSALSEAQRRQIVWRWGRRPACIVFTQPDILRREKYGPIQLLGPGKQAVWYGRHPAGMDYTHPDGDLFTMMPPFIPALELEAAIVKGLGAAGIPLEQYHDIDKASALTTADMAMLTTDNIAQFKSDMQTVLNDVSNHGDGTGQGERLYQLGLRYGALIKASGRAPTLVHDARQICSDAKFTDYETITENLLLADIGNFAEYAFVALPGSLSAGRKRNFARGVGMSKGLGQQIAVERNRHDPWQQVKPKGRDAPAQEVGELLREELRPLRYRVNRYFTDAGCFLVVGKPKIGKGFIILELGLSIAEGSEFWCEDCSKTGVLFYMMEDGKRRIKERIRQLRPDGLKPDHARIKFRYAADGPFFVNHDGQGTLIDDIMKHLHDFPDIKVIFIDVLQRVRGTREKGVDAYNADYPLIGALQRIAATFDVMIVIVHHMKKGKADDVGDSASGSLAITGAVDGSLFIFKNETGLSVVSEMRDDEGYELTLTREEGSPMWKPTEDRNNAPMNKNTQGSKILLMLHTAACELTAHDLSARTKLGLATVNAVLHRLLNDGQVTRRHRGFYMVAGLPYRERSEGIKDVIKRCTLERVTEETEQKYAAKDGAPPGACFVVRTQVVLNELDAAGFTEGKKALDALRYRGVISYNSDSVWLIGSEWTTQHQTQHVNPFALKLPWEV
jgi:hypothetical protein